MGRDREYACSGERRNGDVVELDKGNPVSRRFCDLIARAVIKQRLAAWAEAQALDSGLEDPASELWSEMPRVAREHEASLGEEGVDSG